MSGVELKSNKITRVLVAVMLLECAGVLGKVYFDPKHTSTQIILACTLLAVAGLAAQKPRSRWPDLVGAYLLATPVLHIIAEPSFDSWIDLPAHAARYLVPLAIARPNVRIPMLRIAAALTFAGHGIEALTLKPIFVAYLSHACELIGVNFGDAHAQVLHGSLRAIGTIDILLAISLLRPGAHPKTAAYMAFWGTLTALFRFVYLGPAGIPEVLIRAANGGAPLVAWMWWKQSEKPSASSSSTKD